MNLTLNAFSITINLKGDLLKGAGIFYLNQGLLQEGALYFVGGVITDNLDVWFRSQTKIDAPQYAKQKNNFYKKIYDKIGFKGQSYQ